MCYQPPFEAHQVAGRVRLLLGGMANGEGARPDLAMLEFLYDLGEIAAAGGDIRERLFG